VGIHKEVLVLNRITVAAAVETIILAHKGKEIPGNIEIDARLKSNALTSLSTLTSRISRGFFTEGLRSELRN
jgi:hypothetical protein